MRQFNWIMIPSKCMNRPNTLRQKKWTVPPPIPPGFQQQFTQVHPVLLQVLYNRGLTDSATIQAFVEGRYLASTDPFLLPDMEKAVARIQHAIQRDETIVVYGDFDADGVTSTVLLTEALRGLGVQRSRIRPYIPDRVDEGYGLNNDALTQLKRKGTDLVITVDCGIRSVPEVAHANELGLDMIITDHHSLGARLPEATAVINPKHPDSTYPETMLAGVGIAYKLAQALYQAMPNQAQLSLDSLLDLVAIGTVADLAPLLGENRQLVAQGLIQLNQTSRPGIHELAKIARLATPFTAESIAFGIGPRINAAGRLAHAYTAARLLATDSAIRAQSLAADLNILNRTRQQMTAEMGQRAEEMVDPTDSILIAAAPDFASGIVGLVASRLAEKHYRPAIIIEEGETESRGSCRSIPEFHITDALDTVEPLLERYGGHAQAAGFTVRNELMDEFISRMREIATDILADQTLLPTISADAEIELESVDWALFEQLAQLEPTGYANPSPVFISRNVLVNHHRVVGQDRTHLQMNLSPVETGGAYPSSFPAIAFRQGAWANLMPEQIDIVYSLGVNEWQGRRNLQLMVQDIQPSG